MGDIPPEVLVIILLVSIGYFIADSIVHGVKVIGKKTGCVLIHKGCEPKHPLPPTP